MKRTLRNLFIALSGIILLITSCSKDNAEADTSTNVPTVTVNMDINISAYNTLAATGGTAYIANAGYRGIVLYRYSYTTILAFDRTCTYDLPDASGVVYALTDGTAICPECNSAYNLYNGGVNSGPSTIGLKGYHTAFNPKTGSLIITN